MPDTTAKLSAPWELDRYFGASRDIWGDDAMLICTVTDRGGQTPDIARVIVAAPELLAALNEAFMALGRAGGNISGSPYRAAWETARAAIAKAEGC